MYYKKMGIFQKIEKDGNTFQLKFFSSLNEKYNGKNLIISPLSIYQVLSLTANGAKSKTQKEMISALSEESIEKINKTNEEIVDVSRTFNTINIANAVMTRFKPLKPFQEICEQYESPLEELVDADQVNNWCREKTQGKITEIIDELPSDVVMILLNAIYFKGKWEEKFDASDTKNMPFKNLGNTPQDVPMMKQRKYHPFYEYKEENSDITKVVRLNFKEDDMYALILLPPENININDFIKSFKQECLQKIISNFKGCIVDLELPKFKLEFSEELSPLLKDLGIKEAFDKNADFTNMNIERNIKIDKVVHKTFLKVDEIGTEAAAVTKCHIKKESCILENPNIEVKEMHVDRPFLFMLINSKLPKGNELVFISKIESI